MAVPDELEIALNEATVAGLRIEHSAAPDAEPAADHGLEPDAKLDAGHGLEPSAERGAGPGFEPGAERGVGPGAGHGFERGTEPDAGHGCEHDAASGAGHGFGRGADSDAAHGVEPGAKRDAEAGAGHGFERGADSDAGHGFGRGADADADAAHGAGPGAERGVERAIERAVAAGAELTSARSAEPGAAVSLLLHVLALPETGPPDPDTRRALVFSGVSRVRVLLRRDVPGEVDYGPALPLADFAAVEEFFASLTRTGDMYGEEFLDAPDLVADWPAEVSLDRTFGPAAAGTRSLYWFNECATADGSFCIEGIVEFTDVAARRADGTPLAIEDFVADGLRWWHAFRDGDPRVSPRAQRALPASPPWR